MKRFLYPFLIGLFCFFSFVSQTGAFELPKKKAISLKRVGKIKFGPIDESSGLVRSRLWPEWMWTHNDSGDAPRIFAVSKNGSIIKPDWYEKTYEGIVIPDAVNIDWEDIATDDNGYLIIGAFGNNSNDRRDLAVYLVPEPNPTNQIATGTFQKIAFRYPDQTEFPPEKNIFDCEALFFARGKIYLLTKHRADTFTTLYRFDTLNSDTLNILTLLDTFDIKGQVTAADASEDGSKLAVLTYNHVWLFETDSAKDDYFRGNISWAPLNKFSSKQCESICFWDNNLILGNEQRDLFEIKPSELYKLHP
ncbi:MAG: hypothetical protein O7C75_09410 [Verrucomicrobia bacterium]|nr:hypothetical protein [Verrucomicrobiota bacterium]